MTASAPGIVATNFKRIDKGHLLASVDLAIPSRGLVFRNCLWHRWDSGTERIFFAAAGWTDDNGQRHFNNIIESTDERIRTRFERAALAAVHDIASPGGAP